MFDAYVLDRIGNAPLVRLAHIAAGLPVPVYGKCEFPNPGGSVKDRIAMAIVNGAEQREARTRWHLTDQFGNPTNPNVPEQTTGARLPRYWTFHTKWC